MAHQHNPLDAVRQSTLRVMEEAKHVRVDREAIIHLAQSLVDVQEQQGQHQEEQQQQQQLLSKYDSIAWDSEGWHYQADVEEKGPKTAQYIMVLDALNFCFWPTKGLEYEHLATGLKRVLENDPHAFDAEKLGKVDEACLTSWLGGEHSFPQIAERMRKVQEIGHVLAQYFDGSASNLVKQANYSAVELVRLITAYFPGFRDESIYHGTQVFFYKRAQILVADIWAAYGKASSPHPYGFDDMEKSTIFADYRVPQILRVKGVLVYSDELIRKIDAKEELPAGSEEEVEIRAATIQAVERLKEVMEGPGFALKGVKSVCLDWLLWQEGEKVRETMPPHHRTLTVFY